MSKLKVGIVGFGVVGQRRRIYIDQNPYFETAAVCDQNFTSAGYLPDGIRCYPDYKALLANEELDVLFVCVPNYLAPEVSIAGLQSGMHVFCEKPPARTVEEVESVIRAEKNGTQLLKYGFNHRYHESVREALRLIRSGDLGEIINMRGIYGKSKIIPFSGGWRADRSQAGGGILLDQGIHMVDLMRLFCGEFVEVKSFVANSYWNHNVEDNAYALMKDSRGRVAILHSSATQWQHRFSLDINLTNGFVELRGILSGSKSYGEEQLVVGRRDEGDTGALRYQTVKYLEDNSWRDEINEFAASIVNNEPVKEGTSSEALATMRLVYKIYRADEEWKNTYL